MMTNSTYLLSDENKGNLRPEDMFDKVINLSFQYADEKGNIDTYVLRSDYDFDLYTGSVYKCVYKPSITMSYQKLDGSNDINVRIAIDNFYMYTKGGKIVRNLTSKTGHLRSIMIAVGYFNQFNKPSLESYFSFDKLMGQGIVLLSTTSLTVMTTGEMPNVTTVIDCLIGNTTVTTIKEKNKPDYNKVSNSPDKTNKIDRLLELFITNRFVNITSLSRNLADYSRYSKAEKEGSEIPKDILAKYGVKVNVTKAVREIKFPTIKGSDSSAATNEFGIAPSGSTIVNTLYKINRMLGCKLKFIQLLDGSILVYSKEEENDINKLADEAEKSFTAYNVEDTFKTYWQGKIPAIYTMSADSATMTITCPFFTFLQPLTKVKFATNYGNLQPVASLVQDSNMIEFTVTTMQASFATVDDANEVVLKGTTEKTTRG